jgi:beta-lactamase regulating signal transducer with metallopeptidase domain
MKTSFDMGVAGSLTMIALTLSVIFLLRSFYKRYTNVRKDPEDQ